MINGKPYYYLGTNYWYGGLLSLEKNENQGKLRLRYELDFLRSCGVRNLRVLVGSEGSGIINGVNRVFPPLQYEQGVFDEKVLRGLDYLLFELGKRDMKAVLYLSNNWEWSGGFLQYLNWNGILANTTLLRKPGWDELRDQVSRFYSCTPCTTAYEKLVIYILNHTNHYSGLKYKFDPAIMSWEIANEPRPMRPSAIGQYKSWLRSVAALIKSIDHRHLVTLGTEGIIGTENSADLYKEIHAAPAVDYLTIHIWPKNWEWFRDTSISKDLLTVMQKTADYIKLHERLANELQKPLVIEEFGLPRDEGSFSPKGRTNTRDIYYRFIFEQLQESQMNKGVGAGVNFWSFGGITRPKPGQLFWKEGDRYMGDPPQEEQGLNTVFGCDKSTWSMIKHYACELNNH